MQLEKKGYVETAKEIAGQMEKEGWVTLYTLAMEKAVAISEEVLSSMNSVTCQRRPGRVHGRIKQSESIVKKLQRKMLPLNIDSAAAQLSDMVGVRITCYYLDEIRLISDALKGHKEVRFVKEKDYIRTPKNSGYRSLHLIVEVPVQGVGQEQWVKVEIQIRTFAMDLWACLDHELCYKRAREDMGEIPSDLKEYARLAEKVDLQMMSIRQTLKKSKGS